MRALMMAALVVAFFVTSAQAADGSSSKSVCGDWPVIEKMMEHTFHERPVAQQMTASGYMIVAFVNMETLDWTLVATDGEKACVIQSGAADTLPADLADFLGVGPSA